MITAGGKWQKYHLDLGLQQSICIFCMIEFPVHPMMVKPEPMHCLNFVQGTTSNSMTRQNLH